MKPIKSPHQRSFTVSGQRLTNGRKIAMRCHTWMEKHPETYTAIRAFVKSASVRGSKGRVRDRVSTFCLENGLKIASGGYAFDNTLWAGISRYLVLDDPTLLYSPIEFRDSDIDCYGLLPVSYLPHLRKED